jgi:SAM-dependent methyltransferase
MVDIYRDSGLSVYEAAHYSRGEHLAEVDALLAGRLPPGARVLDLGCSAGLHALELARRGFRVTGVDVEPSAIELARQRGRESGGTARFEVLDLSTGAFAPLGTFDLVYSIGNVLSHLPKAGIRGILRKIRGRLNAGGVFIFDLLNGDVRVPGEIREPGTNIVWKREFDPGTGRIRLEGYFPAFGVTQRFDVWGYEKEEVENLLKRAGFLEIIASGTLCFDDPTTAIHPPVSLRFKAR